MTGEVRTFETTWLGQPALALETPSLRFVTVPDIGAKIVSLFDKQAGREWLLPPTDRDFKPAEYGASFVDQDMSGWDEIFPTTDACAYPVKGHYHGIALPDHGEVWSLPWQVEGITQDSISLSTVGKALPYRLTRTVRAVDSQLLHVEFEAVNTGPEPFAALWAAHPQFAVDRQTQIVLPERVLRVINVHRTKEWPDVGQNYPWPEAQDADSNVFNLDRIGSAELQRCRKFYVLPDEPANWAALRQDDTGDYVRLSWDSSQIPYLGIWVDEGTYSPLPTAALEPTTGYYDRLDIAWRNNAVMRLLPDRPVYWRLDIEIGCGALERVDRA